MSVTKLFKDMRDTKSRRLGRGIGSTKGKTAGRGTKGQKSRAGASRKIKPWFEGGQTPLFRKLAKKRGFSLDKVEKVTITTTVLNAFYKSGETVSPQTLLEKKLIRANKLKSQIKIVVRAPLAHKLTFEGVQTSAALK